jgi:hypothetical protein
MAPKRGREPHWTGTASLLRRTVTVLTEMEQCGITMRTGKLERQGCLVTPKNTNSAPYFVLSVLALLNPQKSGRSLLT